MNKVRIAEVRKALFLNGKTQKDMASDIGVSYGYLRLVMTGKENGENTWQKIDEYVKGLGVIGEEQ